MFFPVYFGCAGLLEVNFVDLRATAVRKQIPELVRKVSLNTISFQRFKPARYFPKELECLDAVAQPDPWYFARKHLQESVVNIDDGLLLGESSDYIGSAAKLKRIVELKGDPLQISGFGVHVPEAGSLQDVGHFVERSPRLNLA